MEGFNGRIVVEPRRNRGSSGRKNREARDGPNNKDGERACFAETEMTVGLSIYLADSPAFLTSIYYLSTA